MTVLTNMTKFILKQNLSHADYTRENEKAIN